MEYKQNMSNGHFDHKGGDFIGQNMHDHRMGTYQMNKHRMDGHMDGHMGDMAMSMYMYIHTNTDFDFLFEGIKVSSIHGIVLAILFTILVTVLFETINFSLHLREKYRSHLDIKKKSTASRVCLHLATAICKCMSTTIGYVAMLIVWTYNIWLILAVTLGSGIGHLLIRPLLETLLVRRYGIGNSKSVASDTNEAEVPLKVENEDMELLTK